MFHSLESRRGPEGSVMSSLTTSRKVNRSCQECTRRKVKCDGGHPCASCQCYKVADSCEYRQRSRRHAVSRRIIKADVYPSTLEKTSEQLRAQSSVLQKLFPDVNVNHLVGKSRPELLALLPREFFFVLRSSVPQADPSPAGVSTADEDDDDDGHDDSAQNSENGDAANERRWDEPAQQPAILGSSDDINAISLATDQHRRSYFGVTTMSAVLRVIFRLCPAAKEHTAQRAKAWNDVHYQSQLLPSLSLVSPGAGMNPLREQRCIDFYFDHIHPVTPILNEDDFRRNLASGTRLDGSWLALLNMVYTLGSIASGSDSLHVQYYKQARAYLDLDSLGSGNMESLQALCLLGGYYLHYRNSPNMAYAVLGAAHRVAIALGLHREPARSRSENVTEHVNHISRVETRRRTWWSLFCLDTWASMTLGRPTCGRWDSSTMDTLLPAPLFPDDYVAASLRASCLFCHICDRIQHRFAQPSRLSAREAMAFDRELVEWHESLPDYLKKPVSSPPRLTEAREFMRNRYLSARLILTRSFLLYLARDHTLRRGATAISAVTGPSPDELAIVNTCRSLAMEVIDAMTFYWTPNRIHVWNSAWHLFQACMVLILSIAIDAHLRIVARKQQEQQQEQSQYPPPPPSLSAPIAVSSHATNLGLLPMPTAAAITPPENNIYLPSWCASLTKALELFTEMRSWMRGSDHTPDIVGALYEAVTVDLGASGAGSAIRTPSTDNSIDMSIWCDEQLAEMDWSAFLGGGNEDGGGGGGNGGLNNNMLVFS
ncbi:fungal specific transcription factor domain-containing protein [Colletotrichum limetticola]|uniref:Fungal specific transcription factor domain-containing protein n=1 Tax=Colletotrichum limetticola TaxID=1209924 RepID=A0ABQ9PBP6_9PEZI|nr:fungal specific transcription factor domain-containing protein [Colletotrichum limetticola]